MGYNSVYFKTCNKSKLCNIFWSCDMLFRENQSVVSKAYRLIIIFGYITGYITSTKLYIRLYFPLGNLLWDVIYITIFYLI